MKEEETRKLRIRLYNLKSLKKKGGKIYEEFDKMKNHAGYTYLMLSQVDGFEDIRDWAALHHEKLNGKGYPFGKTADELNEQERIMACVDIYQILHP